jgi:hypothetical protein
MTALSPAMRASLNEARTADPRPEAVAMWNRVQQLAEASDNPAGALIAYCDRLVIEADRIIAERQPVSA